MSRSTAALLIAIMFHILLMLLFNFFMHLKPEQVKKPPEHRIKVSLKEKPKTSTKKSGEGVGVIEAPRGTLYYWISIKNMKIKYINLVIPTAQNLINMREDVRYMVEKNVDKGEVVIKKEAEKIIRAYDPCMSCASHFLRINFDKKD